MAMDTTDPHRSFVLQTAWALFHPDPAMEQAGLHITTMEESTFTVHILNLYRYYQVKGISTEYAPISADRSTIARVIRQAMAEAILVPFTVSTTFLPPINLMTEIRFHIVVQPTQVFNAYTTYDPAWIRPWLRGPTLRIHSASESASS
jgi:hypothetical protein